MQEGKSNRSTFGESYDTEKKLLPTNRPSHMEFFIIRKKILRTGHGKMLR